MRHYNREQSHGFTLVEVMLYIALTLTILTSVVTFFLETVEAHGRQKNIINTDQSIAFATHVITSYITSSTAVVSPSPGSSDTSLSLTMNDPTFDSVVFFLNDDGVIVASVGGGEPTPITSTNIRITNISFSNRSTLDGRPSIHIEIEGTNTNFFNKRPLSYGQTYHTTVTKR